MAVDVEQVSDDPPERVAAWLATITDAEIRGLDLRLLLDLLRLEDDPERWRAVVEPVVAHVDDLVLLGDFESAVPLVQALAGDADPQGMPGAARHGRRRTRAAGRRPPDGAHGRPSPDHRRRRLRARQGAVSRAGRRGHPAAGRGPGRRRSRARVSSPHRRAGQFRQPGPRRGRAAQELAEPRCATHGDLPAPRLWRQRRAAGTGAAARGRRRQRPARGHPRDRDHRHRRGVRAARKGPDVGIGPLARRDPRGPGHPARRTRPAAVPPHRRAIASTAARRARSTSRRSKRSGRWAGARPSRA